MVEQHQREQSAGFGFVGRQRELAGQPDRLAGEIDAAGVTGAVHEVENPHDDSEVTGLVEPPAGQGALRPADALRHRRLGHVEGVGDLSRAETADGPQRERDLGGRREIRVTAAEQQEERVVTLLRGPRRRLGPHRFLAPAPGRLAATRIDETPGRHRHEPRSRVARRLLRPDPQRLQQRLLEGVLGRAEVLAAADQDREHPRDEGAQCAPSGWPAAPSITAIRPPRASPS